MVSLRPLLNRRGVNDMQFAKGCFVNLSGLEERSFYFVIPDEKVMDMQEAREMCHGSSFLALASDAASRARLVLVEPQYHKTVPKGGHARGSIITTFRQADGEPMQVIDFVHNIPRKEMNEQIKYLATVHLPKLERNRHIRHLPK